MVRLDYLYFGCDSIEESGSLSLKRNTIFEELEKKYSHSDCRRK